MAKISLLYCVDSVGEDAGTERYVVNTIRCLNKEKLHVHLCCFQDSEPLRELQSECSTQIFPLERVFTLNGLSQIRALRRYIDANSVDIVQTFTPKATIFGILAAKKSKAKAIIASRRNLGYWYTPKYLRLFRYLNSHTTRLLANSEGVKRRLIEVERVAPEKIDVLYNGVDMAKFAHAASSGSTPLRKKTGEKVAGVVANYRPVKDLELFLRAAKEVAAEVPEIRFALIGQGSLGPSLKALAAELELQDRVFFSDGIGAVPAYLSQFDVACLSSSSEGFSNSILEYMAAGLPVVATDVGGNAEAIEDGVTGYIVASREPQAFAAPIIRLLRDDTLRTTMGQAALQRCREKFEIASATVQLEAYYLNLLEDPKT